MQQTINHKGAFVQVANALNIQIQQKDEKVFAEVDEKTKTKFLRYYKKQLNSLDILKYIDYWVCKFSGIILYRIELR